MSDLVWTKTKPTEPGWYFFRWAVGEDSGTVTWVYRNDLGVLMSDLGQVQHLHCQWAGPLPLPAEPFDETVTVADIGTEVEVSDEPSHPSSWIKRKLLAILPVEKEGRFICDAGETKWAYWPYARRIREKT